MKKYLSNKNKVAYSRYEEKRMKVKELIETTKKSWQKFGEAIEKYSKENRKVFFGIVK